MHHGKLRAVGTPSDTLKSTVSSVRHVILEARLPALPPTCVTCRTHGAKAPSGSFLRYIRSSRIRLPAVPSLGCRYQAHARDRGTRAPRGWQRVPATLSRVSAFAIVARCRKRLRRDRTELVSADDRVQPALCATDLRQGTFSKLHVINTGPVSYLAFLARGHHRGQSALFISILLRHPDHLGPRCRHPGQADGDTHSAPPRRLISGKAFAAGVRSVAQVVGVLALA